MRKKIEQFLTLKIDFESQMYVLFDDPFKSQ